VTFGGPKITDAMMALRELLEKGSDATLLRQRIDFAAQWLMELEAEAACGPVTGEGPKS
jgi:putative transposase